MKKIWILILLHLLILPNIKIPITISRSLPNDPYINAEWGWFAVGADIAWNNGITGKGVIVAVIDTGVDYNHVELKNSVWNNTDEIAGNGIDDDGNGYVDDIHGWDFIENDNAPLDPDGHGTMVASIIAAEANNNKYYAGVAPDAKIMALRAIDPAATTDDIINAIKYAVDNGAHIISMSFGSGCWNVDDSFGEVLKYAYDHNVLLVAAAGNERSGVGYPASNPYVIAVSAIEEDNSLSWYSNFGPEIELAGPGGATLIVANKSYANPVYAQGTSFAAPYVSGVAALVISKYPNITVDELRKRLHIGAKDINASGIDIYTGYGLVYAPAALEEPTSISLLGIAICAASTGVAVSMIVVTFLLLRRKRNTISS
ncbi:MAG: S8 family peptidase [Candidatus Korarchaeota archaeon]